ncbi:unnamed protein product [Lepeophtheirus salmonis]|uniref:(salmon louse) hypothetical protein n=1 Tax=Lepeophtheirus salmonis TaxID=72036 RepID=A0A817FGT7_LEPSM|nr:unnamed protein product [Lepeophtheirus salmonis]
MTPGGRKALCTAIEVGNESVWDFVVSQNVSNNDPNELIGSLACSKNVSIIEKYLNMTRENQIFNSTANIVYDKVYGVKGYWQVPIDESSRSFTTFLTNWEGEIYKSPYGYQQVYLRNTTQNLYDKYHKEYLDANNFLQKKLWQLSTQWSCKFDNPKCINISVKAVEEWRKDFTKVPNEDIFQALVCTAIEVGNESLWDFVVSQNVSNNDPNELIGSLACSKNVSIIEKYLNMTRENQIFNSTANIVYDKVCETQIGRSAFIDFLKVEIDRIMTS